MKNKQIVLACIDFTHVSEAVADYASWAARTLDAPMELLHVLDKQIALQGGQDHSGAIGLDAQEKLLEKLSTEDEKRTKMAREHGRMHLNGLRERAIANGVNFVDTRLRHGDIEETISEQQQGCRLLVLGRNTAQSDKTARKLGKHLEWVVRSVSRPILVSAPTFSEPKRVLFAFDGTGVTLRGVEMLARSPLLKQLPMLLLMAGNPSAADKRKLDFAVQTLKDAGVDVYSKVTPGNPSDVIFNEVATQGFNLLVMGSYSHSPLRNMFLGSTTNELLRLASIPTLLLR